MLDLQDLHDIAAALRAPALAPQAGHLAHALTRLAARIASLDRTRQDELRVASRGVSRTAAELLLRASGAEQLETRDLRDLTTLCRRLQATVDHVLAPPGPDRLEAESLQVHYAKVDLADAVRRACEQFMNLATERDMQYEVDLPPDLICETDLPKVERALGNALVNAFTYAPRGGFVRCAAIAYDLVGDVIITVEDDGPTVPAAHLDSIFQRAHETERSVAIEADSIRLSLGLSRDLVAVLGGALDTVPTTNGRALFEIRLPRWAPLGAVVSRTPPPPPPWLGGAAALAAHELRTESELGQHPVANDGRPVVLIVARSRALNRAIARRLEPEYATASVFDGADGLQSVQSLRPDLVIVDTDLPEGEALIDTVRCDDDLHTATIAIIGSRDESRIRRLLEIGAHDWICKPLMLAELHARARRLLATKKTQDVLSETIGQRDTDLIALAGEVATTHHNLERAYADLQVARERAEHTSAMKSNFLRIMSHELKTPVTAIKLQLNLLTGERADPISETQERGLNRIARSTRRLLHLVDTSLEWARAEDGRCHPEPVVFDAGAVAEEVVGELSSLAEARELAVSVRHERSSMVCNDPRVVRLVLVSLVERAISVSREGDIEIEVEPTTAGVVLRVVDAGTPLDAAQLVEVFEPLDQTTDVHRRSGVGSGLGVYAVRTIARSIGGEVRWESAGERGNAFAFDVPSSHDGADAGVVVAGVREAESPPV